jgi:hypothetical protein
MLPLGIHAGAPASHPSPAASSPQRQPLLAVWARAYLEGQAQREAQLHAQACEDCGTGDDDDDADRTAAAAAAARARRARSLRGGNRLALMSFACKRTAAAAALPTAQEWNALLIICAA